MHSQGSGRAKEVLGYFSHRSGGKDQGCRFPHNPTDGQNDSRKDARQGTGQNDPTDGSDFPCPQGKGSLTVAVWHREQSFFRCPHNQRQNHDTQGYRP